MTNNPIIPIALKTGPRNSGNQEIRLIPYHFMLPPDRCRMQCNLGARLRTNDMREAFLFMHSHLPEAKEINYVELHRTLGSDIMLLKFEKNEAIAFFACANGISSLFIKGPKYEKALHTDKDIVSNKADIPPGIKLEFAHPDPRRDMVRLECTGGTEMFLYMKPNALVAVDMISETGCSAVRFI